MSDVSSFADISGGVSVGFIVFFSFLSFFFVAPQAPDCVFFGINVCIFQVIVSIIVGIYASVVFSVLVFNRRWDRELHPAIRPCILVSNCLMILTTGSLFGVEVAVLKNIRLNGFEPIPFMATTSVIHTIGVVFLTLAVDISVRPRNQV